MFEGLTNALTSVFDKFRGSGTLTEANIQDGLREVRRALLAADVNVKVVKDFLARVQEKAVGEQVVKSVKPAQQIVKIVHDELVNLMGPETTTIGNNPTGPTVVMMCGLQGSGKTTTCGKLANYFRKNGRKPLLVAADLQRPAAVDQLTIIGKQLDIPVYSEPAQKPVQVCKNAVDFAARNGNDLVILDTAGRLHIDKPLMDELRAVVQAVKPNEILLVLDAMVGQDAVNSAQEFNSQLELNGVILTKLDGDARGGAALSVKAVTGKPIKFIGLGEKFDKLEPFHPERMAGRILGMGDVVTLVEKAQEQITADEAKVMERKLKRNEFDLQDFLDQLEKVNKMGGLKDMMKMLPGVGAQVDQVDEVEMNRVMKRKKAIIQSMTLQERRSPEIFNGSRRLRVAKGAGVSVSEVNQLLKEFRDMKQMMKSFMGRGMAGLAKMFGGGMPPGAKR